LFFYLAQVLELCSEQVAQQVVAQQVVLQILLALRPVAYSTTILHGYVY
jgi:hypothetical protein